MGKDISFEFLNKRKENKEISENKKELLIQKNEIKDINETYELEAEDLIQLKELEESLKFHGERANKHVFKFSEALYNAQNLFSKKGNGNYGKWLLNNNISRSTAHIATNRYAEYLRAKKLLPDKAENVFLLPNRNIKELKEMNSENIIEILDSEKPIEKLKEKLNEIKKEENVYHDKHSQNKIEDIDNKIKKLQHKIVKLQHEIEKLEEKKKVCD